jgi:hypothetical protein
MDCGCETVSWAEVAAVLPAGKFRGQASELAEEENWNVVQHGPEERVVAHPDGDGSEKYVLCRSHAQGEKEKVMFERQMNRFTEELLKMDTALRKSRCKVTDVGKIEHRIGRWKESNPAAARLLEVVAGLRIWKMARSLLNDSQKRQ